VDYGSVGASSDSDPITAEGDERAFCLAERIAAPLTNGRLISGWHEQEGFETWRWTEKRFSVAFPNAGAGERHTLILDFFLPHAVERQGIVCTVNGRQVPSREFDQPGHYRYEAAIPEEALRERP